MTNPEHARVSAPPPALVHRAGRDWEIVIGLETHVQLSTRSKMFSGAATAFGAEPNTQACAVDLALPGVLPVANREAVACAIRFGLAVGATIAPRSVFARKNYFYPDLPKGYQISQFDIPVVAGGGLLVSWEQDGQACQRFVRLTRAHLEEDAGKSLHEDFHGSTGIDLNRAGTPLLEIVTEPDIRSAREALAYARSLHGLVVWLGICDGNMQEGSFRCDANVSVRPAGSTTLGTRCEIKNLNSFRFLERAIDFEVRRQIDLIDDGGKVVQETRLYDPDRDETRSMRSKEDAQDYRYFPDPDLPALMIGEQWIAQVKSELPELPQARRERYISEYSLSLYDASTITASRATADYFEAVLAGLGSAPANSAQAKSAANWVTGEVAAALNREGMEISACPVPAGQVATLIRRVDDGTVSVKIARDLFAKLWASPQPGADAPDRLIDEQGLRQISDAGALAAIVDQVLAAHPKSVEEFKSGKDKAFNALVGQVMKASRGKANPQQVNELLRSRLA